MVLPSLLQEGYPRHSLLLTRGLRLARSDIPWQTEGRQLAVWGRACDTEVSLAATLNFLVQLDMQAT
jgi:hypothetical protein